MHPFIIDLFLYTEIIIYIKLFYFIDKPHEAIGYARSTENIVLAPFEEKQISVHKHTDIKAGTALTENDIRLKKILN